MTNEKEDKISENNLDLYLSEISNDLLTLEEEKELGYKILEGDVDAKKTLIEKNLKLVISIAHQYLNNGMEFIDLIQEGSIGLTIAANKFDITKGWRFSTYATWCIRGIIINAIVNKSNIIKHPYTFEVAKYRHTNNYLKNKLNRMPTTEEISKEMNVSIDESEKLKKMQFEFVSIDSKDNDYLYEELQDCSFEEKVENAIVKSDFKKNIINMLRKCNLNEREINILMLYFGFNEGKCMSQFEIGKIYNITHTRVSQIYLKSIDKIRNSESIQDFAEYMNDKDAALDYIDKLYHDNDNKNINSKKYSIIRIKNYILSLNQRDLKKLLMQSNDTDKHVITTIVMLGYKNYSATNIARILKYNVNKVYRSLIRLDSMLNDKIPTSACNDVVLSKKKV